MNREKLARLLIDERQKKDWSQRRLGQMAGVTPQVISKYESGNVKNPEYDVLNAIAEALNIPVVLIYQEAEIIPPDPIVDKTSQKIIHISNKLTNGRREELFRYAELQLQLQEERGEFNADQDTQSSHQAP